MSSYKCSNLMHFYQTCHDFGMENISCDSNMKNISHVNITWDIFFRPDKSGQDHFKENIT